MTRKPIIAFLGSLGLGFLLALAGMAVLLGMTQLRVDPFAPAVDHGQALAEAIARHESDSRRPTVDIASTGGGYETTAGTTETVPVAAQTGEADIGRVPEARRGADRPADGSRRAETARDTAYGPTKAFTALDRNAP